MIIVGHHRSAALAQRHLRSLQRKYPGATVEIVSRRTQGGKFSARGRYFWYEVTEAEKGEAEFVLHFDYGSKKQNNLLYVQVHLFTPGDVTDEQVLSGLGQNYGSKPGLPEGWRIETIQWGHQEGKVTRTDHLEDLENAIRATVTGGHGRVGERKTAADSKTRKRKPRK